MCLKGKTSGLDPPQIYNTQTNKSWNTRYEFPCKYKEKTCQVLLQEVKKDIKECGKETTKGQI